MSPGELFYEFVSIRFYSWLNRLSNCKHVASSLAAARAKRFPSFELRMEHEVTDLLIENDRVSGVCAKTPDGELDVRANLVFGADGRSSTVRDRAGFEVRQLGVPIDVLWMRLSKREED